MKTEGEIKARIAEIKEDERLYYPVANVFSNAPLALIQLQLSTELNTLERVIEIEPSVTPLKKHKQP